MSDSTPGREHETPRGPGDPDADAWATAAEEDLAEERARRRARYGAPPPGSAADELRRLADAVTDRLAGLGLGVATGPLAAQARAAVEPLIERNAEAFQHLANAGQELLAAYRAAALSQEQRWTRAGDRPHERPREQADDRPGDGGDGGDGERGESGGRGESRESRESREEGENGDPGGPQRIDLD
ncbi:DUF5304 family protein [Streptomyces sp. MS19]|uniref:DUF5304 family protein n=1 Tax=Streptomyces sp. MS19 TaxID=3385972 RepID=UPI0039A26817